MGSESERELRAFLAEGVAALLKAEGFARKRNKWQRDCGDAIQCIDVQGMAGGWGFYVNLGVFHPRVYELMGWTAHPVPSATTFVHARLEKLTPDGRLGRTSHELAANLQRYGLPWLDQRLDLRTCADSCGGWGRTAYLLLAGCVDEARQTLVDAEERTATTEDELRLKATYVRQVETVLRNGGVLS